MDVLDKDEQADVLRCIEYAITDALLFTSVLIGVSPSVPTAIVQLCFVMALAYHVLCIPMIRMAYISETIEDPKWIFHSLWVHPPCLCAVACMASSILGLLCRPSRTAGMLL